MSQKHPYQATRIGRLYAGDPLPVDVEATTYYPAGAVTFGVEGRALFEDGADTPWAGGPTLHVFDTETGMEHLRFDAFPGEEHYHYLSPGVGNHWVGYDRIADGEFVDWIVDRVENRLADLLEFSGAPELARRVHRKTVSAVLVDVGKHLRDRELLLNGRGYEAPTISRTDLIDALNSDEEIAVVDVRERGDIAVNGTLLLAVSIPLSELESRFFRFVPRKSVQVVLIDRDGGLLARLAAGLLHGLGYTDISILAGGTARWSADGHQVYTSVQTLGQAFGEFLEREASTPHISVDGTRDLVDSGHDVLFLDSRPLSEFESHSLPHGVSAPGAEIVHRGLDLIASPETIVVVNCAGRTRSIVGAQALINSGVPNKVFALSGGTMSWSLDGQPLAHGVVTQAPAPENPVDNTRTQATRHLMGRFGIKNVKLGDVKKLLADSGNRTTFVLDVRGPDEYQAAHLAGSLSTPSWDVAPWVFRHIAVLHARIVLVDDGAHLRAALTGSWFVQLGWTDVSILSLSDIGDEDLTGGGEPITSCMRVDADIVSVEDIGDNRSIYTVIDLASSDIYTTGHIPGAVFSTRSALLLDPEALPGEGPIVLTSPDSSLAHITAPQLARRVTRPIAVLDGGTDAWLESGSPLESGLTAAHGAVNDRAPSPWEADDKHQAFRDYLTWETQLTDQIDRDVTSPFAVVGR